MGTRADFYVGRGEDADWLGSIGWDGCFSGVPLSIRCATRPAAFRQAVADFLASREDATVPADGWPWPWDDSRTTDYAYAFDGRKVWASLFGRAWRAAGGEEPEWPDGQVAVFPNMKARQSGIGPA